MDQRSPAATDLPAALYSKALGEADCESCEDGTGVAGKLVFSPSYSSASTGLADSEAEEEEEPLSDKEASDSSVVLGPILPDPSETAVTFAPWVDGDFTTVCTLASSMYGEIRYLQAKDGGGVVAKVMPTKKVREIHSQRKLLEAQSQAANEELAWFGGGAVSLEDPWNEIAILTFLQQSAEQSNFVLRLLGVFQDAASTYVVTEYCEGGEIFECVACRDDLSTEQVRRYVSQVLGAVRHLHGHNVGHRDISLENILLRRDDCVLMDFGQATRLRDDDGAEIRYFAKAGKPLSRAPEMYVPRKRSIEVTCPADAAPGFAAQVSYDHYRCEVQLPADAVPGQLCKADVRGYAVAPADILACGVCAFALAIGKPPWKVARDNDSSFRLIDQHGVPGRLRQLRACVHPALEDLLDGMLRVSPRARPTSEECLKSAWFAGAGGYPSKEGAC